MNVYVLRDPNDLIVKYVGLTSKSVAHRLNMHIKDAKTRQRKSHYLSNKDKWLLSLISKDQRPIWTCLVRDVEKDIGIEIEQNIIEIFKRECDGGTLVNVQRGGSYDCDKTTPWNRGLKNCYSDKFMEAMKKHQSNRITIFRFDTYGNFIDSWISVRTMCSELNLDRRTVQRCLHQCSNFISHKGYMFSYGRDDIPVYSNKSITHGKYCKKNGKE